MSFVSSWNFQRVKSHCFKIKVNIILKMIFKNSFYLCVHFLITENWWSVLEPPLFLKIVELFKEVVVHLLKLYKIGIPPSERRIFNSFLHTALKVLEILHRVCPIVSLFFFLPIATNRLWCLFYHSSKTFNFFDLF